MNLSVRSNQTLQGELGLHVNRDVLHAAETEVGEASAKAADAVAGGLRVLFEIPLLGSSPTC